MIKYSAAFVVDREFPTYWMPASAGMTSGVYLAYAGCFALASIWPIASTTASKVSMVEACRAL